MIKLKIVNEDIYDDIYNKDRNIPNANHLLRGLVKSIKNYCKQSGYIFSGKVTSANDRNGSTDYMKVETDKDVIEIRVQYERHYSENRTANMNTFHVYVFIKKEDDLMADDTYFASDNPVNNFRDADSLIKSNID